MKIEITANGKTIQTEINEEQAKILGLTIDKPKTGYERVEKGSTYFFNDGLSDMNRTKEEKDIVDQGFYDSGNYYSDRTIAENNARADSLLRHLRQWQALNDKSISIEDWGDNGKSMWCIMYSYGAEKLYANNFYYTRLPNVIYFTTQEKAEDAIEQFADELIWYFVEYQQRLDEE